MKSNEITTVINLFDNYFENNMEDLIADESKTSPKVDVLIYSPTQRFKFWKLISLGASDYSMPKVKALDTKNKEYVMFVDKDVRFFINNGISKWYLTFLKNVAKTIKAKKLSIAIYDVIDVNFEDGQTCFATFLPIMALKEPSIRCKLSTFKDCEFIQVMPLSSTQAEQVKRHGKTWCLNTFYPEISEGNEFFAKMPSDFHWKIDED